MSGIADADGGFLRQKMFEYLNGELTLVEALEAAYSEGHFAGTGTRLG